LFISLGAEFDVQFIFSNHVLDTDRRELSHDRREVPVEPQVFDLLVYLLENRDRVVSKDDLLDKIWSGRIVSESTLTRLASGQYRGGFTRAAYGGAEVDQGLLYGFG
jgi:DNA-binding response OmpR family regulator